MTKIDTPIDPRSILLFDFDPSLKEKPCLRKQLPTLM